MGNAKQWFLAAGVGCGLAIAVAVWPAAAGTDGRVPPPAPVTALTGIELTGDDGGDDDGGDDARDDGGDDEERVARTPDGTAFELEIDPELDARFGPRPVNGVQAAGIATAEFGGRVVAVELDEEGGRPVWEVELAGAAVDEVDVDAIEGRIR